MTAQMVNLWCFMIGLTYFSLWQFSTLLTVELPNYRCSTAQLKPISIAVMATHRLDTNSCTQKCLSRASPKRFSGISAPVHNRDANVLRIPSRFNPAQRSWWRLQRVGVGERTCRDRWNFGCCYLSRWRVPKDGRQQVVWSLEIGFVPARY